jgi:hypothetical protein
MDILARPGNISPAVEVNSRARFVRSCNLWRAVGSDGTCRFQRRFALLTRDSSAQPTRFVSRHPIPEEWEDAGYNVSQDEQGDAEQTLRGGRKVCSTWAGNYRVKIRGCSSKMKEVQEYVRVRWRSHTVKSGTSQVCCWLVGGFKASITRNAEKPQTAYSHTQLVHTCALSLAVIPLPLGKTKFAINIS